MTVISVVVSPMQSAFVSETVLITPSTKLSAYCCNSVFTELCELSFLRWLTGKGSDDGRVCFWKGKFFPASPFGTKRYHSKRASKSKVTYLRCVNCHDFRLSGYAVLDERWRNRSCLTENCHNFYDVLHWALQLLNLEKSKKYVTIFSSANS